MIIVMAFLAAAALGWYRAVKRGGTLADRIQYALAHGIPAGLAALVVIIIATRMGWLGAG